MPRQGAKHDFVEAPTDDKVTHHLQRTETPPLIPKIRPKSKINTDRNDRGYPPLVYPYALRTRKSAGLMTRKLSVTESQKTAQFFGTSSRRKCRTDRQNSL